MKDLTAEAVEDQKSLKTGTLVSQFTNAVEYQINDFFSNGVVTSSIIVRWKTKDRRWKSDSRCCVSFIYLRLPCQWSIVQGETIDGRYQFELRLETKEERRGNCFRISAAIGAYRWQLVPNRQRQLVAHVCQHLFHWRRCWMNHHLHQWFCPRAFDHRAGYRVLSNTIPSKRYQFEHQLGQHGSRYIHAWSKEKFDSNFEPVRFLCLRNILKSCLLYVTTVVVVMCICFHTSLCCDWLTEWASQAEMFYIASERERIGERERMAM